MLTVFIFAIGRIDEIADGTDPDSAYASFERKVTECGRIDGRIVLDR